MGGEAELAAREVEVDQRLRQARERHAQLLGMGAGAPGGGGSIKYEPPPNFPPEFCCVRPFLHHDIEAAVPETNGARALVKETYYHWIVCCGLLLYNSVVALVALLSPVTAGASITTTNSAQHFGISILYLVAGIPGAFAVWYYQVYRALAEPPRTSITFAQVGIAVGFLFTVFLAIGISTLGGCGWMYAIGLFGARKAPVAAIMACVSAGLFSAEACVFMRAFYKLREMSQARMINEALGRQAAAYRVDGSGPVVIAMNV
jgi:hypothetical protein